MVLKQCRHGRTESPPAPVTGLVSFMGHQCVCRENPKQLAVWLCARPGSACQRSPFLHSCSCTASAGCCLCSLAPALLISLERHNGEPQEQAGWRQLCPQHPASQMVPPPIPCQAASDPLSRTRPGSMLCRQSPCCSPMSKPLLMAFEAPGDEPTGPELRA